MGRNQGETVATGEDAGVDFGNMSRNHYAFQSGAVPEGLPAKRSDALRNGEILKAGTLIKGCLSNFGDALREGHRL